MATIFLSENLYTRLLAGKNSMGWLQHHASTSMLEYEMYSKIGLDKILQARFSSSTWRVSEATIRRLYINLYGITEGI